MKNAYKNDIKKLILNLTTIKNNWNTKIKLFWDLQESIQSSEGSSVVKRVFKFMDIYEYI